MSDNTVRYKSKDPYSSPINSNNIPNDMGDINNVHGYVNQKNDAYSAPINFNTGTGVIGSYDNIRFQTSCDSKFKRPPCSPPEKSSLMWLPQGTPLPLKSEMIYTELPKDSLFVFAKTTADPLCSSQYSTDRGQLCLNDNQKNYFQIRGTNKTYENYNF